MRLALIIFVILWESCSASQTSLLNLTGEGKKSRERIGWNEGGATKGDRGARTEEEKEGDRHPPQGRSPPTFQPRLCLWCEQAIVLYTLAQLAQGRAVALAKCLHIFGTPNATTDQLSAKVSTSHDSSNYHMSCFAGLVEIPSRDVYHYRPCVIIMINGHVTAYHYNDTRSCDVH